MTDIRPSAELFEKGTWRLAVRDGALVINLCCPQCGGYGTINGPEGNHEIAADGTVSPSVVCDCGFHEFVRLLEFGAEGRRPQ